MKKTSIGTAVAGAILCALALAGCQGKSGSTTSSGGAGAGGSATVSGAAVSVTTSAASGGAAAPRTTAGGGNPGDGVPSATPTGTAAIDSELNTVNQQLGTVGTDLAQATASPSDGG
jgi:hypothetical protein